jgi:hypothetical protein
MSPSAARNFGSAEPIGLELLHLRLIDTRPSPSVAFLSFPLEKRADGFRHSGLGTRELQLGRCKPMLL